MKLAEILPESAIKVIAKAVGKNKNV